MSRAAVLAAVKSILKYNIAGNRHVSNYWVCWMIVMLAAASQICQRLMWQLSTNYQHMTECTDLTNSFFQIHYLLSTGNLISDYVTVTCDTLRYALE